jgi:5-methylcytosine-specific restriction endonuclease McrA
MTKKKDYPALEKDQEAFDKFRNNFVMAALRRATYRWPYGHIAMGRQRVERGFYTCEDCKEVFGPKEINKDHIEPVIPVTGKKSWDETIERMFVKSTAYQILCINCHDNKTKIENLMRVRNGQKPIRTNKKSLTKKKKKVKII